MTCVVSAVTGLLLERIPVNRYTAFTSLDLNLGEDSGGKDRSRHLARLMFALQASTNASLAREQVDTPCANSSVGYGKRPTFSACEGGAICRMTLTQP